MYAEFKSAVDTSKEEGKIEGKIEVAKTMKDKGESIAKIGEYTGLSIDEIENLDHVEIENLDHIEI